MAKYFIELSEEDAKFLTDLQHELKNQDCSGTAKPCYLGVTNIVYEDGNWREHDLWKVEYEGKSFCKQNDMEDFWRNVKDQLELTPQDVMAADWEVPVESITPEFFERHKKDFIDNIDDAVERLQMMGYDLRVYFYQERRVQIANAFAFTVNGCKTWIDAHEHNLTKPEPYIFTGAESPELVRVMEILQKPIMKE